MSQTRAPIHYETDLAELYSIIRANASSESPHGILIIESAYKNMKKRHPHYEFDFLEKMVSSFKNYENEEFVKWRQSVLDIISKHFIEYDRHNIPLQA